MALDLDEWGEPAASFFRALRSDAGEEMILDRNLFVEAAIPAGTMRTLPDEAMAEYRRPFAEPGEGRRPTLSWPRQLPVGGEPAEVEAVRDAYARWLAQVDIPKLFVDADPGSLIAARAREVCRAFPAQTEVTVPGLHYVQEDSPDLVGQALGDVAHVAARMIPTRGDHVARIRTIPPEEATGELSEAYEQVATTLLVIPGVFQLLSIRPDIAGPVAGLVRAVLSDGELSRAAKETIATYVSALNQCPYCVGAHTTFMQLYGASAEQVRAAEAGDLSAFADDDETRRFLPLAEKITRHAYKVTDDDVESLRRAGWSDEAVLEAVSVVLLFTMINRLADTFGLTGADFEAELALARDGFAGGA